MTVAEQLVDILEKAGVKRIYGVTGDALNGVVDSIRKRDNLEWIAMRHEENAAFAAYAEAALTGSPAVCAGTVGPGALHLINGLYNAKREGVPVLAITGQVATHELGTGFFQEVNLIKAFEDICKYQAVIRSPEQAPRIILKALQETIQNNCVCRIEIPVDIANGKASGKDFIHPVFKQSPSIKADTELVADAAKMINDAKKVSILAGEGCRNAKEEVLALAKKIKAPIVHSLKALDIFDHDTPNVVGLTGLIGNATGYHAIMKADVIIMMGTNFPYTNFLPDKKKFIQVDLKSENIGNRVAVDIGIIGDAKAVSMELGRLVDEKSNDSFLNTLQEKFQSWRKDKEKEGSLDRDGTPMHPQIVTERVNHLASNDAVFIIDVGEVTVWAARHLVLNGNRRLLGSFSHGTMGVAPPSAIGAQLVNKNREVWALVGDGAFVMNMQDFVTAARYRLPIKIIVYNNEELSFVKMEMEEAGLPIHEESLNLKNPDFAKYAEICGGKGITVTTPDQMDSAIMEAKNYDGPCIIDARVTAGELLLPPKITLDEAWGFSKSKVKELFLAVKGEKEQWKNIKEEMKAFID